MVASMTAAAAVPHFHFCDEVNMAALQRVRQRLASDPALMGARLTYMPFILKARMHSFYWRTPELHTWPVIMPAPMHPSKPACSLA